LLFKTWWYCCLIVCSYGCLLNIKWQKPNWHKLYKYFYYGIGNIDNKWSGIATSYGLDKRGVGVQVPVGSRIFSSPCHPNRLCGPPSLLSTGYRG
jgi:hypothetical protein